jgi:hypothetical protein
MNYMLIYYLVDIYNSGMRSGLFEILTALILELSSSKEYCTNLKEPIQESVLITGIPIVSGSYADLFFVTFSYLMIESDQHMGYFANFLAILKNLSFHVMNLSTLASNHIFLLVKKYLPYPMMLKNYNNILLFKDLIELADRIMTFRSQFNQDFHIQLVKNFTIMQKAKT